MKILRRLFNVAHVARAKSRYMYRRIDGVCYRQIDGRAYLVATDDKMLIRADWRIGTKQKLEWIIDRRQAKDLRKGSTEFVDLDKADLELIQGIYPNEAGCLPDVSNYAAIGKFDLDRLMKLLTTLRRMVPPKSLCTIALGGDRPMMRIDVDGEIKIEAAIMQHQ